MTITTIKVENVKGAVNRKIDLRILANRPSLMVAPNGFGKSSITAAFASLSPSKLKLEKEHFHKGEESHRPKLTLTLERTDGSTDTLVADENRNTISQSIDVFVINSRLEAKATKRNMGGFTSASASLEINAVVLIDKIPNRAKFNYSAATNRKQFGANGKVLPNIEALLSNPLLTNELWLQTDSIAKFAGVRNQLKLTDTVKKINGQAGSVEDIQKWAEVNLLADLEKIDCLRIVADIVTQVTVAPKSRIEAFLAAYQICKLHENDLKSFKDACAYNAYLCDKESFTELVESFDTTWVNVKPKESKGKLIVEFPKAFYISNGQRDSLCFAALMLRAKKKLGKRDCILIIDEVFDYLDDANLTAAQYYVSNFIDEIKGAGHRIYPLIFTHLNPFYFKNYAFSDQKIYFLDKRPPSVNEHFRKFIVNREDASIKAGVEKNHLHFYPTEIDLQAEFKALGLKETWGKSEVFHAHIRAEWGKYKGSQIDYDPFAICCFVRVQIEKQIYMQLNDPQQQQEFLDTHGTKKKLKYAKGVGINVPEVCYLLGVIYNDGLHFRNNADNTTSIVSKLENLVIRKMALQATNE
jgi:hypothetical protein